MNLDSLVVELYDDSIPAWVDLPVSGLTISEDSQKTVRELRLVVKASSRALVPADLLTLHRQVRVELVVDGDSYSLAGRVAEKPRRLITPEVDEVTLLCYDQSHEATRYRLMDAWPKPGVTTWSEIVEDAWTRYGPAGATFFGLDVNPSQPSYIACPLNTLFEFMEEVSARTGWAWRYEDGDLAFHDPSEVVSPVVIAPGTAYRPGTVVDEGLPEIANVVIMPAILELTGFDDAQDTIAGREQYFLQYTPVAQPAISVDGIPVDPGDVQADGAHGAAAAHVVWSAENRFVRFSPGHVPAGGLSLVVTYDTRLPVRVTREHASSIELYGRIEHVIRRVPRPTRDEARELAQAYLDSHALPVSALRMGLLTPAVRAGQFHRVVVAEEGIDQLMPCSRVERSWSPQRGVQVNATFRRSLVSDGDLVVELFRRLNALEARETSRSERIESVMDVQDTWTWTGEVTVGVSLVNYPADSHELVHLAEHVIQNGRLVYPA